MEASLTGLRDLMRRGNQLEAVKGCRKGQVSTNSDQLHLEHHMYAAVPCYNLEKLHRVVAHDMPETRTLIGAWKEMRKTWKRQQNDPGYEFDTPVPAPEVDEREDADPLAASIEGLAPRALA